MVSGCGPDFEPYFEESLLDLLVRTGQHPSRFVREAGFHVLNSLVSVCTQSRCAPGVVSTAADADEDCCYDMEIEEEEERSCPSAGIVESPLERFSLPLAQMLAAGLADTTENWAQVR
jgi:hypothetical protein